MLGAVLAGTLHGLCFAPWNLWFLAPVAPAPLIAACRTGSAARAAVLGWLAGTVAASLAVTPWITRATLGYFRQGPVGAVLFASSVGQIFHALPTVAFALGVRRIARHPVALVRVLATAGLWTGLELLRANLLTGAPWDLLGHALHAQPLWIQPADLGGVYLLSFACLLLAGALAEAPRAPRTAAVTAAVTAIVWLGYGAARLAGERDDTQSVRLALVQGAVPNGWRADPARHAEALAAFDAATREALAADPDLVVWPENAVSFLLEPNDPLRRSVGTLLRRENTSLLTGAPRFAQAAPGRVDFFNSAVLLDDRGTVRGAYDKRRLVPFAEYAPLPRLPLMGWRFDAPGDYTPGRSATVFREPVPFGVLICFEVIYPDLARDLVREGAEVLVNISNDAWFGSGAGLEQHFAIAVFRAVEFRRALARATNTGITALVGPSGRVLARFPVDVRGGWTVTVPRRRGSTVYARLGDGPLALLATVTALAGLRRRERRRRVAAAAGRDRATRDPESAMDGSTRSA